MSLSLFYFESLRESFLYFNFNVNLSNILVKRVFNFFNFVYCADVENYESFKSFGFIYIYRLVNFASFINLISIFRL